ncbi:Peptide chain release factor class I [Dillenia turbinata]|uniref:Peptide chain release factor class I n=1 Tax=Dillenia turbinata TaxID=194707 RepID=A0AAN8W9J3_9MAGN
MAAIRSTAYMIAKEMLSSTATLRPDPNPIVRPVLSFPNLGCTIRLICRRFHFSPIRCSAETGGDASGNKVSARLSQMQQLLQEAEERALSAGDQTTPKITLDHVTVSFARSGGPGGQNVNKVNTKVDMRFNIKNAYWLSDRIRERIVQMEKNRINKDGEIVISSTKTRTQKGNIEDALGKLQAIIDAAAYVPPPPSEEQKKKIAKLAAIGEQRRLQNKKALSQKKAIRRARDSWD